jgi:hypothetical protein
MDFRLDSKLMSLLMVQEVADWIAEHCLSGAAPAMTVSGLVYRIEDEEEALAFQERWLPEIQLVNSGPQDSF